VSLFWAAGAVKENGRIRAELVDYLAASTTGRAGHSSIIRDRNRLDFDFGSEFSDCREDRRPFGTVGHTVRRVLHVTTRIDFAVGE